MPARVIGRALEWAAAAVVAVAAAPVTIVAVVGLAGAWLRGWSAARLRRAAAWSLPMTAVYLIGCGLAAATWRGFALAPLHDWRAAWDQATAGRVAAAFVLTAPLAVPAGLAAAAGLRAWRVRAVEAGLSGRTATTPVVFDARQWRRAASAARGRVTAPSAFPLATRRGRIVMGATIRAVGHRWRPVTAVPYQALGRRQVVIGSAGCGKTTLMMRTWAGWHAAALQAHHRHGSPRPLLVVLDCEGGPDARVKAQRTRTLLHAAGARRVAIWPDEATVSVWGLPPADLAATLDQLIDSTRAATRADATQALITRPLVTRPLVTLAVTAPPGPPACAAEFLARLEAGWLEAAYAGDSARLAAVTAARPSLADVRLRSRALLQRLGPGLDGPGTLTDADAWYVILEGAREQPAAEAQAITLIELVAQAAASRRAQPRAILLACDDYPAVSGQVSLWQLFERGRNLGVGVQASARSWQGLGRGDDERTRICAAADGGIWLMRTRHPQPVCELAGSRRVIETASAVIGAVWGDDRSCAAVRHAWTVDPGIARRLAAGQAGYVHAGGCAWVQVARARPAQPAVPAPPAPPAVVILPARARPAGPPSGGVSDDVLGRRVRP